MASEENTFIDLCSNDWPVVMAASAVHRTTDRLRNKDKVIHKISRLRIAEVH